MTGLKEFILDLLKNFGTSLLESAAVLLAGIVIIKLISRALQAVFFRAKFERTAVSFLTSLVNAALGIILFFIIMRIFKIDTSSVVAIVAAAGLALGLSLQDSLSNVASGIILLFTKPFKEGEFVRIDSAEGTVKKIKITTTELLSPDNTVIVVPNKSVVNSNIVNFTAKPTRRLDLKVSVSYQADGEAVQKALYDIASADERILLTPAPVVTVTALNEASVTYQLRVWVQQSLYWPVANGFCGCALKVFKERGIEIPYNKLQIYMAEAENV